MSSKNNMVVFLILIVCAFVIGGIIYYYNSQNKPENYVNCDGLACDIYNTQDSVVDCLLNNKTNAEQTVDCLTPTVKKSLNNVTKYIQSRGYTSVKDFIISGIVNNLAKVLKTNHVPFQQINKMYEENKNAIENVLNTL